MKVKSLRYRIAATIFILQAMVILTILLLTLNSSLDANKKQIAATEEVTLKILSELGRTAFLTNEYNDLQPYLEIVVRDPHVLEALLLNPYHVVYASHDAADIGFSIELFENTENTYWRTKEINNATGNLGSLHMLFSNHDLERAYRDTIKIAFTVAIIGLLFSAITGIILGTLLTRRLDRLSEVTTKFARGDLSIRADLHHSDDEINDLTRSFNHMADDISKTLHTLRESEDRFRGIFLNANDAVFIIDLDNDRIVDANPSAANMLEYDIDELLITPVSSIHQNNRPKLQAFADKVFKNGSAITEDLVCTTKKNKRIAVSISASLTKLANKTLLLVQTRDISARKQREESLRRSQKMEAVGQLSGGIAHDFNNILGIILGNLELLERQLVTDEKTQKKLDAIKHSAQRAADLTKKMLSFSRHESASTTVTNINQLITEMHPLLQRSLTPQVEITKKLAADLWQTEIDQGDFEDTLLNLTLNARDAMAGSGQLTIETCNCVIDYACCSNNATAEPGEYIQLIISDNGEGMSQAIQDRIFEPFFTTKEVGKGTGLGLAMVFGFVERSGGCIKVYSETNIGTTFRLYLPRTKQKKQGIVALTQIEKSATGNETVLIVDDETEILALAKETLQALGYHILSATDGHSALHVLASEPKIDLLFSDVVMPGGLNGFELAKQAITHHPLLKVLLTSGYTNTAMTKNGQAQFATRLLNKPYSQQELALRIRESLDGENSKPVAPV